MSVEEGTSAGLTYRQTAVNFTLNTGSVLFTIFGTSAAQSSETTSGIIEIATQPETDDAKAIAPLKLKSSSLVAKMATGVIGDDSATQYGLMQKFGTKRWL